jgi:Icc-related predicted phosphoesterase
VGLCFFVADLHGHEDRYAALFRLVAAEQPEAVFLGGDLLPSGAAVMARGDARQCAFVTDVLAMRFKALREQLGPAYPRVFLIPGNDDLRAEEEAFTDVARSGVWEYIHGRHVRFGSRDVYGYACVPPTPFTLKDWERYDVSRHVDPGCVSPEAGLRSVPVAANHIRYATIQDDLAQLAGDADLARSILLFHAPPYQTSLDRAALDGRMIDHVPLDVHVGSIAIRRFIEARQPLVTLHGHVHESARLTGAWSQQIGRTRCFSAAHDGPELALVRFDPDRPESATRTLEAG